MNRWIITTTAEDGTESAWGLWADADVTERLADKLGEAVGDETGELRIRVQHVDRWPGLKRAIEELAA